MKRQHERQYGAKHVRSACPGLGLILIGLLLGSAAVYGDSVYWTGAGGTNDNWSNPSNWWATVPGATDNLVFNGTDSGNQNVVDGDFTIGRLRYAGDGVHTMDLAGGSHLEILNGPVQVGWDENATVTWTNGGRVTIGSPTTSQAINIGRNGAATGTVVGALTIETVQVDAHLQNGGMALGASYSTGSANGQLTLGPGAQLNAGTPTELVSGLTVGYNHTSAGSGTGLLDTSGGAAQLQVQTLYVGNNYNGSGTVGSAAGTLTMDSGTTLISRDVHLAAGANATGVVNLNGGLFSANTVSLGAGGTFNFNGGRLAVDDFATFGGAGTLEQKGGTLAPGFSRTETKLPGTSVVRGNYVLDAGGTLEIELFGTTPGIGYDQLQVLGEAKLAGSLDVKLGYEPLSGDQFTIIDVGNAISGQFAGLSELSTFEEMYQGEEYTFQISYCGFSPTGNDVVLKVVDKSSPVVPTTIPAPGALMLAGFGAGLLRCLRHRHCL